MTAKRLLGGMLLAALITALALSQAAGAESPAAPEGGYSLVWQEEFDGNALNREDWNVELHEKGWVNEEWQEYVDSGENIRVENGALVLRPVMTKNADGSVRYTSGRINTRDRHDFLYGWFEARLKVPKGQGYLPAFWMMPSDDSIYGGWPRGGEIDIMEIMGQDTKLSYHTVHYGLNAQTGHHSNHGTFRLKEGSFDTDYHVFAVNWEPGEIVWYVDGTETYRTSTWYTGEDEAGIMTYPAPFDQPFHIILNLAVGGSWVGYPDDAARADMANQAFYVDYVRVYQKDPSVYAQMEDNVQPPVQGEAAARPADEKGNYVLDGSFSAPIPLEEEAAGEGWVLHLENDAKGSKVKNAEGAAILTPSAKGGQNYSIQLKQTGIPVRKGWSYELTFDARAEEDRTIVVDLEGPDNGWVRYLPDTLIALNKTAQHYRLAFVMTEKTDDNGSLEFNLGNHGSLAEVSISNVSLVCTGTTGQDEEELKQIRPNGNYIYNGTFDQGENRLGYWDIEAGEGAEVSVTNQAHVRRLMVQADQQSAVPAAVSQSGLYPLTPGSYVLKMDAMTEGDAPEGLTVEFAGETLIPQLTDRMTEYRWHMTFPEGVSREEAALSLRFTAPGTYYVDNVVLEEDALIRNGGFDLGLSRYITGVFGTAKASFGTALRDRADGSGDAVLDAEIHNTGGADWEIQLKQDQVLLTQGKTYRLTFDAWCTIDRVISVVMQREGSKDNNWEVYSGGNLVRITPTPRQFELTFTMHSQTDENALLSVALGTLEGKTLTDTHHVYLDNFRLEVLE